MKQNKILITGITGSTCLNTNSIPKEQPNGKKEETDLWCDGYAEWIENQKGYDKLSVPQIAAITEYQGYMRKHYTIQKRKQ